jgi:hypothetical protein
LQSAVETPSLQFSQWDAGSKGNMTNIVIAAYVSNVHLNISEESRAFWRI